MTIKKITKPKVDFDLKNEENKNKAAIKSYILEAISSSTIHAIDKIFKPRRAFLKVLWVTFFIASNATCGFFIANSIISYLGYEVVTKVQVIYEVPQLFPTVAICSSNALHNNQTIEFGKKILEKNGLSDPFRDTSALGLNLTLAQMNLLMRLLIAGNLKIQQDLQNMSIKYDELFISCTFNLQPCDGSMFEWYFDIIYGSCFRFNYKNVKPMPFYSYRAGMLNSLKVELFAPLLTDPYSFSLVSGAYVVVQNASDAFDTGIGQRGIGVEVGTEALIQVQRTFISKLEKPYSECVEDLSSYDSELYETFIKLGKEYKQSDCFDLCYQKYVSEKCKCIDSLFYPLIGQPYCLNASQLFCDLKLFTEFYSEIDIQGKCGPLCPLECNSQNFDLTISSFKYPTPAYADQLVNYSNILDRFVPNASAVTYDYLKEHILALDIFYSDMKYVSIEELGKTSFIDLISGVGGTLGLFIGMSFLSFFEIIDVLIEVFIYFMHIIIRKIIKKRRDNVIFVNTRSVTF